MAVEAQYHAYVPSSQRCSDCYLPTQVCLCDEITAIGCGVQFVVLQHVLERRRNSNTGRLVGAALKSSIVVDYATPDSPFDLCELAGSGTALLYPGPTSSTQRPDRIILLDASWSQARRMAQRIPQLRGMPRLGLPTPARVLPRMREGGAPEQMSTAESAIAALHVLGEEAAAEHLRRLLCELVRRFALPKRKGHTATHEQ